MPSRLAMLLSYLLERGSTGQELRPRMHWWSRVVGRGDWSGLKGSTENQLTPWRVCWNEGERLGGRRRQSVLLSLCFVF